jgi:hypothetical protein
MLAIFVVSATCAVVILASIEVVHSSYVDDKLDTVIASDNGIEDEWSIFLEWKIQRKYRGRGKTREKAKNYGS